MLHWSSEMLHWWGEINKGQTPSLHSPLQRRLAAELRAVRPRNRPHYHSRCCGSNYLSLLLSPNSMLLQGSSLPPLEQADSSADVLFTVCVCSETPCTAACKLQTTCFIFTEQKVTGRSRAAVSGPSLRGAGLISVIWTRAKYFLSHSYDFYELVLFFQLLNFLIIFIDH